MKTNKQLQSEHRRRKREKGLIPKEIWIFPEDWENIKIFISKKTIKRIDIITSNDIIEPDEKHNIK